MKWSEGLSKRVPIIIRRYIGLDLMKLAACMAVSFYHILSYSFGSILYHCTYGCVFCKLLFNFVNYVFLLLCKFRSVHSVSFCCSVYCLCVNVYCTAATGCQHKCS
jgi:hypothetical protein